MIKTVCPTRFCTASGSTYRPILICIWLNTKGHGPRHRNLHRNRRVDITFVTRDGEEIETSVSAADPGETWIIAFDQSDDVIKNKAQVVTGQLDFKPNETLVVRRMGGDMALSCRAQAYAFITNFPPVPFIRFPNPFPLPPPGFDDVASPN